MTCPPFCQRVHVSLTRKDASCHPCLRSSALEEEKSVEVRGASTLLTVGLCITVFGCGWVLMGLEIIGGRMLSPYFGSGVWVWGSIISVFLGSLSFGYYAGGLLSRRFPQGGGLAAIIFFAGVAVLPVAFFHRGVSEFFADLDLHERWGALLAATTLFFGPSALLGMVSPYAVRLAARSVSTVGVSAGTLYAVSTLGSFLGCLLTAFYFILWMGIQTILFSSAGALALIAAWQIAVGMRCSGRIANAPGRNRSNADQSHSATQRR